MISLLIANLPSDGAEGKIKQELLKLLQKKNNPSEEEFHIFTNKIKEIESLDLAFEHQRNQGRLSVRSVQENTVKEETPRPMWVHPLCGKTHKKGDCSYVCKGCKMIGSHKPEVCWKLHPQLKPEHMKRKDERYRYRERSRSREGGEGSKRGREKSPHPNRNSV